MAGSQDIIDDPRNEHVRVWVNGALLPRAEAAISVFDGGYIAGDGVWEGLRLARGRWLQLDQHLDRLFAGAAVLQLPIEGGHAAILAALEATRAANDMSDGVHARLMVTRGTKRTPAADPRLAVGPATVVIIMEYKLPKPEQDAGLALMTSTYRTTRPDQFDMRLNSHSRLPYILALMQAYQNGADEALMLDDRGYVASCNSTNFFFVADGVVRTSAGRNCFNGITRGAVIDWCTQAGIPLQRDDFALMDVITAREAFVTGTAIGVKPVRSLDGRLFPGAPGPVTTRIAEGYRAMMGL